MSATIDHIFREAAVVESNKFHVVYDKFPVCPEHMLVFPKRKAQSFADLTVEDRWQFSELLTKDMVDSPAFFFERGRAAFCTSFTGPKYGHCHILPARFFTGGVIEDLVGEIPCKPMPSVEEALQKVQCGEYLLFGEVGKSCFLSSPFSTDIKRFVRGHLLRHLNPKG